MILLLVVVFVFVIGCVKWFEVEEDVNWGIVLMYGGAIVLGLGMLEMGASEWMVKKLLIVMFIRDFVVLLFVIVLVVIWFIEVVSNAVVVVLFMFFVFGFAMEMGFDFCLAVFVVVVLCGYVFVFLMGMFVMVLVFFGGHFC